MGASKGLQSLFSHSLDLTLPLLVSSWECSEISMSLSIGWITFCHVILDYVFHSMSLVYFLLGLSSFFLSSTHPFTLSSLDGCFGIWSWPSFYTVHLSRAQYFIFRLILDSIFDSMLIFSLQKGERHIFTFTHFSRESPWPPYYLYLMELELKVNQRYCCCCRLAFLT